MSPEDLNEGDLQCGDLAVHEDSCQVKLHLETHVHLKTRGEKCKIQTKTWRQYFKPIDLERDECSNVGCTDVGSVDGG